MKYRIIPFILNFIFLLNTNAQDTILFRDGKIETSRIIEINPTSIKYNRYDNLSGPIFVSDKSKIYTIKYFNAHIDSFNLEKPTTISHTKQIDSISKIRLNNHRVRNNVLCGEILGGNFGLSINYERVIINREHFFLNGRVGLGTLLVMWSSTYSLSGNIGGRNNFLEFGFGRTDYTVLIPGVYGNGSSRFYYPLIGYRYQKKFVFKFQLLGLMNHHNNQLIGNQKGTTVIFGLSLGKAF